VRQSHSLPLRLNVEKNWSKSPGGFTLVELLVVIAIIGVMVSLLLPAIQAAREAARRMNCQSNIKQWALAIQNYESAHQELPPSGLFEQWFHKTRLHKGKQFSWIVLVLPYVEGQALHDQFDLKLDVFNQDSDPQAQFIDTLLCPSDSAQGRYFNHSNPDRIAPNARVKRLFAKGNFAAYVGPVHTDTQLPYPGALTYEPQPLSRLVDGTSHTLMLAEVRTRENDQDERGAWALPWTGATLLSFDMHDANPESGSNGIRAEDVVPYRPRLADVGLTQPPNSDQLLGDILLECPDPVEAQLSGMKCNTTAAFNSAASRSLHPGGVNIAFVDGHVSFLNNDIDEYTMACMVSINDGIPYER
jgi:prepilin-type N-terminal cleavage/methylation domain-containing protein/prepilin-type processing-associated H-X9-DG protein